MYEFFIRASEGDELVMDWEHATLTTFRVNIGLRFTYSFGKTMFFGLVEISRIFEWIIVGEDYIFS